MNEKIERLNRIQSRLKRMVCSDRTIEELEELVDSEYRKEFAINSDFRTNPYFNNLRQTQEKQLGDLLKYKSMPRKRISYFNDTTRHFGNDIEDELNRMRIING